MDYEKMDYEKIAVKCKEEGKDFIPSNWYIPARKMWQVVAWLLIQLRQGRKISDDKTTDKMIHSCWQYIEEHAIVLGKEEEDGTTESNS